MMPIKNKIDFNLKNLIVVSFRENLNNKANIKKRASILATAAPYKEYAGIKVRPKTTLTIAPNKPTQRSFFWWLKINSIWLKGPEMKKSPTNKIKIWKAKIEGK